MSTKRFHLSVLFVLAAVLLGACGLLGPFADALAVACEQEQFVVTKTTDTNDGICTPEDCSLREAVITANACPGSDTIVLSPGTYTLTIEGADEDEAAIGDLDVSDSLVLHGNGAVIDGNGLDRIFDVQAGSEVEPVQFIASELALQHGVADQGGGIRNHGFVQLGASTIRANLAERGGGIYNDGHLVLGSVTVRENADTHYASGILNAGTMEIHDSTIVNNHKQQAESDFYDGSVGVVNLQDMIIRRSVIEANNDDNDVGIGIANGEDVIWSAGSGLSTLVDASLELDRVTIAGHRGQGIVSLSAGNQLTMQNSVIRENDWRAIEANGTSLLETSTISGNGAIDYFERGCGTVLNLGSMEMANVTLSGNHQFGSRPHDCAVILNLGSAAMRYVTLYQNDLHAVNSPDPEPGASASLLASIIGQNETANCQGARIESLGQNIFDDESCSPIATDQALVGADFNLGPLAENGSFNGTLTHALLLGSPAIEAAGTDCPESDQRLVARPQGSRCDAGAYELDESFITVEPESPLPGLEVRLVRDALCYSGPGDPYPVVGSLLQGSTARVLGLGAQQDWLVIDDPRLAGVNCWVKRIDVEEPQALDPSSLKIFAIPPLPTPTPAPEKAVGCLVQNPNDPKQVICVPRACTPNDQPGGNCTP